MQFDGIITNLQDKAELAFDELAVSTKNITNVGTPGYKRERLHTFAEVLEGESAQNDLQRNMQPGKLNITSNPNDVSLEGQGFFVALNKNDDVILTRNLTLSRSKDGYLTSNGNILYPKKKIPNDFQVLEVETDGTVLGKKEDGSKIKLTKLEVINYPGADKLCFDGQYYYPTEEAGNPLHVCLGIKGQTLVRRQTQESSNVDIPSEFVQFKEITDKLSTLARLNQLINSSQREYIRTLTAAIG
jgi:flagellar basal body rod protein FlgG